MNDFFKDYLFKKYYLVGNKNSENQAEVLISLQSLFSIKPVGDLHLLDLDMVRTAQRIRGNNVPEPFYRGFPESVKLLTPPELLIDQIIHYTNTYLLGNFKEPGHSVFEADIIKSAFNEHITIREYNIIDEELAMAKLYEISDNLLSSSRPLNKLDYSFIETFINDYNYVPTNIKSKNTAIKLILSTRNEALFKFIELSDVIKLVDNLNFYSYNNKNFKSLNLKNRDRKFISRLIDYFFINNRANVEMCFSKKRLWCGLLHHIHYRPINDDAHVFITSIRDKGNISPYHYIEKLINNNDIKGAVDYIITKLGSGSLIRYINYLASRSNGNEDIDYIINNIKTDNAIVLIQLYMSYTDFNYRKRQFTFNKFNMLKYHLETFHEAKRRGTIISKETIDRIKERLLQALMTTLAGRLDTIYIDPSFKNIGVPYNEATTMSGLGVLPKGSRIPLNSNNKKLRAFTYWEKISDIDLACFVVTSEHHEYEFSWRTYKKLNNLGITFSGDQTSGYKGGSEYFDIERDELLKSFPTAEYVIFTDNVFSDNTFNNCICKAGYMLRDKEDSGEVFEPKTVESSFAVTADSHYAYLFAIDLIKDEFVWLNMAKSSNSRIACDGSSLSFLKKYINSVKALSMYDVFNMMAKRVTDNPNEADIIISDKIDKENAIHSYDIDKMLKLLA